MGNLHIAGAPEWPLKEERILGQAEEGMVCQWDTRRLSKPWAFGGRSWQAARGRGLKPGCILGEEQWRQERAEAAGG